jgi:2-methylisocitrate lyase-like PEP mutase family enzyme
LNAARAREALKRRLGERRILLLPGVAHAMAARMAAEAGFEAAFISGAALANVHWGFPDIGLIGMAEVVEEVRRIANAVDLPLIADGDTGYGNAVNVLRTVRELEATGVAGILLEDQVTPKRCGHFAGKQVVDAEEMLQKIAAFREARQDPNLVLVARTDAYATHGLEEAIRRGQMYAEAGADVIFVEAPTSVDELRAIAREIPAPTLANMVEGGRTPVLTAAELEAMGFRVALFANTVMRAAAFAAREALRTMAASGSSAALADRMLTWQERQELVRLPAFQAAEDRFVLWAAQRMAQARSKGGGADRQDVSLPKEGSDA